MLVGGYALGVITNSVLVQRDAAYEPKNYVDLIGRRAQTALVP